MGPETLFHYLYVNANMSALEDFDPTTAILLWMTKRKPTRKIIGVFKEASQKKMMEYDPIIEF